VEDDAGVGAAEVTGVVRGASEPPLAAATGPLLNAAISREPTCREPAKAIRVKLSNNPAAAN
jgi:hypothetical protein